MGHHVASEEGRSPSPLLASKNMTACVEGKGHRGLSLPSVFCWPRLCLIVRCPSLHSCNHILTDTEHMEHKAHIYVLIYFKMFIFIFHYVYIVD